MFAVVKPGNNTQMKQISRWDPRLQQTCIDVYGPAGKFLRVRTLEDNASQRMNVSERRTSCGLGHPYGRIIRVTDGRRDGHRILYVEIPKTGSTYVKAKSATMRDEGLPLGDLPGLLISSISFTVVREPLQRFLSGYGTIISRLEEKLLRVTGLGNTSAGVYNNMTRTERFGAFVDLVIHAGDRMGLFPQNSWTREHCVWYHTMTQMWFIELMPQRIDYTLHVETLDADLMFLANVLDIPAFANSVTLPRANVNEGGLSREMLMTAVRKNALVHTKLVQTYLKQDYTCLGYSAPTSLSDVGE
jgi:hypothetical protein